MVFDPAQVEVGDTVAGLRVAARDVRRAADGEWVGTVRFAGTVVVRGQTMAHPDDPHVGAPCFAVDSASAARLPRWAGDTRRAWFCFANPVMARERLGAPDAPRAATLTLDAFTVHHARSDVVNTARLVRADGVRVLRVARAVARVGSVGILHPTCAGQTRGDGMPGTGLAEGACGALPWPTVTRPRGADRVG